MFEKEQKAGEKKSMTGSGSIAKRSLLYAAPANVSTPP